MADCFWTDLVGVDQNCGGGPTPPSGWRMVYANYENVVVVAPKYAAGRQGNRIGLLYADNEEGDLAGRPTMPFSGAGMTALNGVVYWAGVDYSGPQAALKAAALPLASLEGNFDDYNGPLVDTGIPMSSGVEFPFAVVADPNLNCLFFFVAMGFNGEGVNIYRADPSDLSSWQLYAHVDVPPGVNVLSDNCAEYDEQLGRVVYTCTDGLGGSEGRSLVFAVYDDGTAITIANLPTQSFGPSTIRVVIKWSTEHGAMVSVDRNGDLFRVDNLSDMVPLGRSNISEVHPTSPSEIFVVPTSGECYLLSGGTTTPTGVESGFSLRAVDAAEQIVYGR